MPPRSGRRRGVSQRWLIIPFVLTILVILVDASMHARSLQPEATMDAQAWVDKVLPDIAASSGQGLEIEQVSSARLTGGSEAASSELSRIASAAASTYRALVATDPPSGLAPAAGLLEACLVARQEGAAQMATSVRELLGGTMEPSAVAQMTFAVSDFQVSDTAYRLFAKEMPKLGVTMPASQWTANARTSPERAMGSFAQRLLAGVVRVPRYQLAIDAVTTNPPALSMQGKVEVLSPASTLSVTAVVGNVGQAEDNRIRVTATITPAQGAPDQHVSATVNLSQGQADAVALTGLKPVLSTPTTLTVSAVGSGGGPTTVSKTLQVELPGPGFTGTTTTTTATVASTTGAATTTTTAPTATTFGTATTTTTTAPAPTTTAPAPTTTAPAPTTTVPAPTTTVPAPTAPTTATTGPTTTATPTTAPATSTARSTVPTTARLRRLPP